MQEFKESILTLEQQKRLSFSGVSSVDAFSESEIRLTVNGKKVRIGGSHLKVLSFSEGSGNFTASGEIESIRFGAASSLRKLLK